jgi:uncharacterized membrane protein
MTCIVCGYEFCWNCLEYAGSDADHFNPLNPSSCGVGMMQQQLPTTNRRWLAVAKWIGQLFLFIILLPLFCVLWFPIFLAYAGCKCKCGCCCNSICSLMGLIFGLVCAPLVAPLTLLFVIGFAFYSIVKFCRNIALRKSTRKRREQQARERVQNILEQKQRLV